MLESGVLGPRRGAVGRVDRLARSGRAARRRQDALPRQGRAQGGRATSTPRSAKRCIGLDATRPGPASTSTLIELDGTENKAASAPTRCSPSRCAVREGGGRRMRRCRCTAISAAPATMQLPVPMMNIINGGAHANNSARPAGVHDPAGRRADVPRGAALRRRDLPHAEEAASTSAACRPRSATKAASRRTCRRNEAALKLHPRGDRQGRLQARHGHRARPRLRELASSIEDGKYQLESRGPRAHARSEFVDYLADWCDKYPIITIEDGMAEDDWDGWKL